MYIYFTDLFTCYFKFRLAHRLRYAPCGASYTVHTDSFTAHNNNNFPVQELLPRHCPQQVSEQIVN